MSDHRPVALVMSLRGQGIDDQRVLEAVERTPRELFVEKAVRDQRLRKIARFPSPAARRSASPMSWPI